MRENSEEWSASVIAMMCKSLIVLGVAAAFLLNYSLGVVLIISGLTYWFGLIYQRYKGEYKLTKVNRTD
ncbi:MAG: hypothetical protein ACLFVX_04000 [Archaeoglobaceae archaeon]